MKRSITLMIGILTLCGIGLIASSAMAIDGPQANATVSFGEWKTDFSPPLDRLVGDPAAGAGNNHELIPNIATIKEGGSVNFIISGGHIVAVYDDGTQPEDIGSAIEPPCPATITAPCSPGPADNPTAGGILSDSNNRIYRGAFLNLVRRDGVEVVKFSEPGTYLVICARKNHFVNDGMFGFVKVLPGSEK
jgi:hypothetical protein